MKILSAAFILGLVSLSIIPPTAGEQQIMISANSFAFIPGTITLKVHQRTKLVFLSKQEVHGITIPEIDLSKVN